MKYQMLSPITIGNTTFRNRVLMSSMVTNFGGINSEITDRLIAYHVARARGGLGLNMLEATTVHDNGLCYAPGLSLAHDKHIKGMKKLVDAVHAAGGKMGVQINHAGRNANPNMSRYPKLLVSFVPGYTAMENSRVMDQADIDEIVASFADAAARAKEAGFDIIEIHGAHGYLINQFLSPVFNHREDNYGGSLENRMRFAIEVITAVRARVGEDYPLSFRCSVEEFVPQGTKMETSVKVAQSVVAAGINLFHVSAGMVDNNWFIGPTPHIEKAWNKQRAGQIKKALANTGAKVAVAGRIIDRESAESIIAGGFADMVAMGRAHIAEAEIVNKIAESREEEIIPCIGCSEGCGRNVAAGEDPGFLCALNPWTGEEILLNLEKHAAEKKKVVVVGAGPAGMHIALRAAEKKHDVCLYEKSGRLGGLINIALLPPHKEILGQIIEYYSHALLKAGVKLHLGFSPSVEELKALKADHLFICTGSSPALPGFLAEAPVLTAEAVLTGAETGNKVLVLGGGMVGCETAEFLGLQGKDVTVLELRSNIAQDMHSRHRHFLLENFAKLQIKVMTDTELKSVSKNGVVTVKNAFNKTYDLPKFDTIITALGYKSENSLAGELMAEGLAFTALGDCKKPGKIMDSIRQAHKAAFKL